MQGRNEDIFVTLPQATQGQARYGSITRLDKEPVSASEGLLNGAIWGFLFLPVEIAWARNTAYAPSAPIAALPYQSFSAIAPWIVNFTCNLSTLYTNRRLDDYVDAIADFSHPASNAFAPPPLRLELGSRVLSPCVLSSVSRIDTGWSKGGDLTETALSLSFTEVPKAQLVT